MGFFATIVIPAYNCEKTIGRLLQSIADQDMGDDLKVIITDDSRGEDHENLCDYVESFKHLFPIEYYKRESESFHDFIRNMRFYE